MVKKDKKYDVGVIIARFQVAKLHEAHRDLIQTVIDNHPKVVIFLGLSPLKTTFNNPLDFQARKQMILEDFPDNKSLDILYIKDEPGDDVLWSKKLDGQIRDVIGPNHTAVLYGSRDSFIGCYHGGFDTIELEPTTYISGTELRNLAYKNVRPNEDFRAGIIYATGNKYPQTLPTVDIAIFNEDETKLLLARKPNEPLYRFVGGFANPGDTSYEGSARREVAEETHLEVGPMIYVGSSFIDDARYRKEVDKIKTIFFKTKVIFGSPQADDDIAELRWFDWVGREALTGREVMEIHKPLLQMLKGK